MKHQVLKALCKELDLPYDSLTPEQKKLLQGPSEVLSLTSFINIPLA